jgi:hypothetical protein
MVRQARLPAGRLIMTNVTQTVRLLTARFVERNVTLSLSKSGFPTTASGMTAYKLFRATTNKGLR